MRRIGAPPAEIHGPGYTLVNLKTTFYTVSRSKDVSLTLIGYAVNVNLKPTGYTWHWGDGTTQTTKNPGRPYPSTDITHTYTHATTPGPPLRLSVDVTYTVRYRVDSGPWITIPATLTIPGPTTALPVKQASAVLVPAQ